MPASAEIETDAVVIGAGPVGLFQVFEFGLIGIRAQLMDSLPVAGGQCITLYADKPIYDIPATPVCTGRELIEKLLKQIEPFGAGFHLGSQVDSLRRLADGRFRVVNAAGVAVTAKVVVVAGGAGSFQPRRLKIDGIAAFEGTQLFYGTPPADRAWAGERLIVIGDDEAALDFAIRRAEAIDAAAPASVTLMHRRDEFRAAAATIERMRRLRSEGRLQFVAAQPDGVSLSGTRLAALRVRETAGDTRSLPLDTLVAFTGLSPKLGPIADWGLALDRKQIVVDTAGFETREPGIFAVGDVNTYPGKKKLIVCGFHEAALAAYAAAAHVFPGQALRLEYTTTSPRLHRVLGLAPLAAT